MGNKVVKDLRQFLKNQTGSPFVLWDDTLDPAPIYVPNSAPPRVVEAANDLADYMQKSSGKTIPTVTQQPSGDSVPSRSIKVGYPNDLTNTEESKMEYIEGQPLELTGVDVYDPNNPDFVGQETDTEWMSEAGTYHSVMTFIQEYIGVVWGWIGDLGEVVPSKTELKVDPISWTHIPDADARNVLGFSMVGNGSPYGIGKTWLKKQRAFFTPYVSRGHAFKDWYDKYHPDGDPGGSEQHLFALQNDGTRSGYPFGNKAKVEVGEPDVDTKWINDNVATTLSENPHRRVISASFNDGNSSGHSLDSRAQDMDYDEPDAITYSASYENSTVTSPVITDREIAFAKRLIAKLDSEGYTDKKVSILAYGPSRPAPKREEIDHRIYIVNTANDFNDPTNESRGWVHRENMDNWLSAWGGKQIWRPNIGNGHGHNHGMWLTHTNAIGSRLKTIIPQGCTGLLPDAFWEHWSTQWPMYYLTTQLLWDSERDPDQILNEAYNKLFGNASSHVKSYYEETGTVIENNQFHNLSIPEIPKVWTDSVISTLQGHIDSAYAAVSQGTDEYTRVEWVDVGFQWSKDFIQSCKYWVDYNAAGTVTNETNLATKANAIEDDTDGTAGWSPSYVGVLPNSQSAETNGSNFAWFFDNTNTGTRGAERDENLLNGNIESGTASSGTLNTVTDTTKTFTSDQFVGKVIYILSGTNAGEYRLITGNTTDTITVRKDFTSSIDSTSEYEVTTMYLISFDAKHTGIGGRWVMRNIGDKEIRVDIDPEAINWKTYEFAAFGGDQLQIREWNTDNDGDIYVDNLKIQEAEPVDQESIKTTWDQHNSDAYSAAFDWGTKWDGNPPIGHSVDEQRNGLPDSNTETEEFNPDLV